MTTGKDALIRETDLDENHSLDAGSWFSPDFSGEGIPLLDEVVDLPGNEVCYDIEIKHWDRGWGAGKESGRDDTAPGYPETDPVELFQPLFGQGSASIGPDAQLPCVLHPRRSRDRR